MIRWRFERFVSAKLQSDLSIVAERLVIRHQARAIRPIKKPGNSESLGGLRTQAISGGDEKQFLTLAPRGETGIAGVHAIDSPRRAILG